jgi:hypothetical protein
MQEVKSSLISHISHNPATNTLRVRFPKGGHYNYANVTPKQFEDFKNAESVGNHFLAHFKKNEKHPYTKVIE